MDGRNLTSYPKTYMEIQMCRKAKIILKKERKIVILPDFKTYYKATVIKTMWHGWAYKSVKQFRLYKETLYIFNRGTSLI